MARLAQVNHVAVRGKGTELRIEYDLRYLDGAVTSIDLGHNNLEGTLPPNLPESLPYLQVSPHDSTTSLVPRWT